MKVFEHIIEPFRDHRSFIKKISLGVAGFAVGGLKPHIIPYRLPENIESLMDWKEVLVVDKN